MSNDSKEFIPYLYCNGSFVTQSVYLSNNAPQFDCLGHMSTSRSSQLSHSVCWG